MPVQMGGNINIQTLPQQVSGTQQTQGNAQASPLPGFSPGDSVQAQVTDVTGMTVTMETPDGATVQAQFPNGVPVNPGDIVDATLVSVNRDDGTVNLRLNAINGQNVNLESSGMQAYLMEQGIAPSKLNEGAAQLFLRGNITPTPRNVANLVQIATTLPEIPTSVAMMMAQNNIPPTQENANLLAQWAQQPAALGQDVQDLAGMVRQEAQATEVTQVFQDNVMREASPEQARVLQSGGSLQQLAENLGNLARQSGLENMTPKQIQGAVQQFVAQLPVEGEQAAALENLLTQAFTESSQSVQAEGTHQTPQQAAQTSANEQTPAGAAAETQTPAQTGQTQGAEPQVQNQTQNQAQNAQNTARPQGEQPQIPAAQTQETQVPQNAQTAQETGAPKAQPAEPREAAAQEAPVRQEATEGTQTKTQPEGRRLVATEQRQAPAEHAVKQEASQLLSNLGKMVARVRPGNVQEDAQNLREVARDQQHLANMTKEGVARLFGQTSGAAQKANDMSAQVRLGNQIEQFYYAQVPFQTMQQEGTAELYVFQRQGQKSEAERTHVTILIGLDTQHMGRVETVLRSMEEHLSVEFRVESARVQNYFEDSMKGFKEEMSDIGFPLENVKVSQIKEKVTPLNAMKVMEPKQEIRLQGLDIEA